MDMTELRQEIIGLFAQALVFTVGMAVSLAIGIMLAARTDEPSALLLVTIVAGAGLLFAAVVSPYGPYQSEVHSHTLPCMSASPHRLNGNVPTGAGFCRNSPAGPPAKGAYGYRPL